MLVVYSLKKIVTFRYAYFFEFNSKLRQTLQSLMSVTKSFGHRHLFIDPLFCYDLCDQYWAQSPKSHSFYIFNLPCFPPSLLNTRYDLIQFVSTFKVDILEQMIDPETRARNTSFRQFSFSGWDNSKLRLRRRTV